MLHVPHDDDPTGPGLPRDGEELLGQDRRRALRRAMDVGGVPPEPEMQVRDQQGRGSRNVLLETEGGGSFDRT